MNLMKKDLLNLIEFYKNMGYYETKKDLIFDIIWHIKNNPFDKLYKYSKKELTKELNILIDNYK